VQVLRPPPRDRSLDGLRRHYETEKAIASRLKAAPRDERKRIYATMYDDLFRAVPDHPRLRRRVDARATAASVESKLGLLRAYLRPDSVFLEFAPGDCSLVARVARTVAKASAVDISDQRADELRERAGYELVVYDGYLLDSIADGSVDVAFSDQLIEHLHLEDVRLHFELVRRLLRPGGVYVFRTPHALTGPHDVSMYFSEEPEGFHIKEWNFTGIRSLLRSAGYASMQPLMRLGGRAVRVPAAWFSSVEAVLGAVPKRFARLPARYLLGPVAVAARTRAL
jgi:SAM-dependent methyltransferase